MKCSYCKKNIPDINEAIMWSTDDDCYELYRREWIEFSNGYWPSIITKELKMLGINEDGEIINNKFEFMNN
jgi:hypothetical protein